MSEVVEKCRKLLDAYHNGKLGEIVMPENSNPGFSGDENELRLAYFTLPMALNYQRNSYKLWEAALATYTDKDTRNVFNISWVADNPIEALRGHLVKYKLALQPNKHINTWFRVSNTIHENWGTFEQLFRDVDNDFLRLRDFVQKVYKKGFPYLSGPKIFNYWSYVITEYGKVPLKNIEFIEIAPDTHVVQASVKLGVITQDEAKSLSKETINSRWRELLKGSDITPIEMHSPLWFWSRGGFTHQIS